MLMEFFHCVALRDVILSRQILNTRYFMIFEENNLISFDYYCAIDSQLASHDLPAAAEHMLVLLIKILLILTNGFFKFH